MEPRKLQVVTWRLFWSAGTLWLIRDRHRAALTTARDRAAGPAPGVVRARHRARRTRHAEGGRLCEWPDACVETASRPSLLAAGRAPDGRRHRPGDHRRAGRTPCLERRR